jgi:hypothetical protein
MPSNFVAETKPGQRRPLLAEMTHEKLEARKLADGRHGK